MQLLLLDLSKKGTGYVQQRAYLPTVARMKFKMSDDGRFLIIVNRD